jgi:uncharacterized protein YodC (DUF2158 family)
MARIKQNQQNPPLPKRKRVDSKGNDRRRMILKDGGATMIIATGCTEAAYSCAWSRFISDIEAAGGKVTVTYRPIQ